MILTGLDMLLSINVMFILMICKQIDGEIFKDTFFAEYKRTAASEIRTVSFLRIFFCFFGQICFALSQMFNVEIF